MARNSRGKKVVVIGAGLGGISAALSLALKGYAVRVFEKNGHVGGKLNVLREQGYTFDMGPSILTLPHLFERVFEAAGDAIDILMMGDDFGTQQGPMMSLSTWRRCFKPGFGAFIELAHRYGIKVMHHTCGSVVELIPDFIECGLDILQSLQPQAAGMDLSALRRTYGRDLCFHGGIDIQGVLPHGRPEQVREHVCRQIEAAGTEGGYILCTAHNIQPDTPLENVLALFAAYEEFG